MTPDPLTLTDEEMAARVCWSCRETGEPGHDGCEDCAENVRHYNEGRARGLEESAGALRALNVQRDLAAAIEDEAVTLRKALEESK